MLSNFHVRWPADKFRALHRSITSEILRIVPFVHPHYIVFFWVYFGIKFVAIKHSTHGFRSHFQNSFVSSGSPVQPFKLLGNASAIPQLPALARITWSCWSRSSWSAWYELQVEKNLSGSVYFLSRMRHMRKAGEREFPLKYSLPESSKTSN